MSNGWTESSRGIETPSPLTRWSMLARSRSLSLCPPNSHTSYVAVNQGLPDRIQEPDFPVAMRASRFPFFIPNRSASALVHPEGTRSNV